MKILVTGAGGQLGQELKSLSANYPSYTWKFAGSKELNVADENQVKHYLSKFSPDVIVNCAAYTAVDKAESDQDNAYAVNVEGVSYLAANAGEALLIHVSTDFVYDGNHHKAYQETDPTNPVGMYGKTKLEGEQKLRQTAKNYVVLRTSWLYGSYGKNFMKTMLALAASRSELSVVADQIGTPTYTGDLAQAIVKIIENGGVENGVYHFSNEGAASWYDFAHAIFELSGTAIKLNPINTEAYPTPAKRPHFSVLDKTKIKNSISMDIPHWRDSLKVALGKLDNE